jgi:hypothetical protein
MIENQRVRHALYPTVLGRVVGFSSGKFSDQIKVQWDDGRSFSCAKKFLKEISEIEIKVEEECELDYVAGITSKPTGLSRRSAHREIVRKYINTESFNSFIEYLKSAGFSLSVETSDSFKFEDEYKYRLGKNIDLPESAVQLNKWGTQIRLHFNVPADVSLIPFEEAPSGSGGSYTRAREVWINKGGGRGEITNWDFNWELREKGLLFDFEKESEATLADNS